MGKIDVGIEADADLRRDQQANSCSLPAFAGAKLVRDEKNLPGDDLSFPNLDPWKHYIIPVPIFNFVLFHVDWFSRFRSGNNLRPYW